MSIPLETLELPLKAVDAAFNSAIKIATAGVTALVGAMGLAINATFKWAEQLDGITDVMDVSNDTAAALNFTLRKSGVATETFTKGMVILNKGLVDAKGKLDTTGKALKNWGINVKDANGQLKDQTTLIGEVSDKYATFSTQQEKVNFLTEVFGKSGAELIDFFDTIAADGGIDAVTNKVKAFGLAIDPSRYEQFNRNLEELKLIGLGMAVSFTEKVMPMLEKFLGWFTEFAQNPDLGKALADIDQFAANIVDGLAASIQAWIDGGGAERLTQTLVGWISGIGTDETTTPLIVTAAQNLIKALGDAFTAVDWTAVKTAMGLKIQELFAANQPTGQNSVRDFWNGLEVSGTDSMRNFWNKLEVKGTDSVRTFFTNLETTGTAKTKEWVTALGAALGDAWGSFVTAMNTFETKITTKLKDIAKAFFNAGGKWVNQAAQGFMDHIGELYNAIRGIVAEINKILKKIITSFHFGVSYGVNNPQGYGGTGHGTAPDKVKDDVATATGGSFMIPSSYGWEGYPLGPGRTASGGELIKVTPRGGMDTVALDESTINKIAERMAFFIGPAIVKASNSV